MQRGGGPPPRPAPPPFAGGGRGLDARPELGRGTTWNARTPWCPVVSQDAPPCTTTPSHLRITRSIGLVLSQMSADLISSRIRWHWGHVTGPSATTAKVLVAPHNARGGSYQSPTQTSCTAGAPGRRPCSRAGMGSTVTSRRVPATCPVSPGRARRPRRRRWCPSSRRRAAGGHGRMGVSIDDWLTTSTFAADWRATWAQAQIRAAA